MGELLKRFKAINHFSVISIKLCRLVLFDTFLPVDAEWVKDCNISINAEDDSDDHDSHQNTLQEGMIEVWIESIMQVSDIVPINFVQLHDDCWDHLECEVAEREEHLLAQFQFLSF